MAPEATGSEVGPSVGQNRRAPETKYQKKLAAFLGKDADAVNMDGTLTTADVPRQFLKDVYMVGQVPLTALRVDPRISYALFVPVAHYDPDPSSSKGKLLPLLVDVHGTTRVFSSVYAPSPLRKFAQEPAHPCAVLAPLFPAGVEGPHDVDSYKVLRSRTQRSDLALLAVLEEVAHRWPGIDARKIYMTGFSGGGQFALRFLYLYPERLAGVSVGAPGRVTALDDALSWPRGVADVARIFDGVEIRRDLIAQVPIQLVVGGEDTKTHGNPGFWEWMAEMKEKKKGAGGEGGGGGGGTDLPPMEKGRLETLRELQAAWKVEGIEARLDVVPGVAHNVAEVRDTVLDFMRPLIRGHH
ncbi:hypothetical protein DL764_000168 [Monosporascus ibericus]|uniref:Carboxylic ester hydrolase n=1 Tax=Monosporascus ibericus TaxID=155417 RepID=A0A4Q4TWA9_9PEZI|nr:hypothetical protein DL764_000168 [Monosporascus ibericus]